MKRSCRREMLRKIMTLLLLNWWIGPRRWGSLMERIMSVFKENQKTKAKPIPNQIPCFRKLA
jgi:hypothetical protein